MKITNTYCILTRVILIFLLTFTHLVFFVSCSKTTSPTQTTIITTSTQATTQKHQENNSESADQDPTINVPIPINRNSQDRFNDRHHGYTHINADGNRYLKGSGQLTELSPLNIQLPGVPTWLVSIPWKSGSLWAVILEDGRVFGFTVSMHNWSSVDIKPNNMTPGQPPMLIGDTRFPYLLTAPSDQSSLFTHPIPTTNLTNTQVFINKNEELVHVDKEGILSPIADNALLDARILRDERNRLIFLSYPTQEYKHGVLGDAIEAKSITRIDNIKDDVVSQVIQIPENLVIEGIAPIWTDLNGDMDREIIVTTSNVEQGAKILVYSEEGKLLAVGPSVGKGFRWRHQIAVAPFGNNGELELVAVLTPHLGGIVEYFRLEGDKLNIVAQLKGYTSHIIGTRNLDMAVAGDFDGDGQVELVLPNQALNKLAAIRRTENGAEEVWSFALDAIMTTNIGATTLEDGNMVIGVGLEDGILRIWHP